MCAVARSGNITIKPGFYRILSSIVCTALFYPLANASAPMDLPTEEDLLAEIPLVSSAARLPQRPEDSPATVTVIDRDMIRMSGAINLADIFRLVPGFQVGHVTGNKFSVTSHGLADEISNRLLVLVDGRSLHTAFNSGVDWANTPLEIEDIERIEVISGPNVASYGANAFNGVIYITTRQPFLDQGTYIGMTAGSQDTGIGKFRYGGRTSNFDYRISGSYREDDGFDDVNDDTEQARLSFRGIYQKDLRDHWDVQLGLARGDYGIGFPNDRFTPERTGKRTSHHEYLRWTRTLNPTDSVYVQFYHNRYRMDDDFTIGPLSEVVSEELGFPISPEVFETIPWGYPPDTFTLKDQTIRYGLEDINTDRYDLEFQHVLQPTDDFRMAWGAGLRYETIEGEYWLDGEEEDLVSRLYVNGEKRFMDRLVLNLGANLEDNNIVGTEISPRIAFNYHFSDRHTLRLGAARAYRTPSLLENNWSSYFEFDGGPPLARHISYGLDDPEEITSYEIGYIAKWPEQALTLDMKLYRERIDPVIRHVNDRRDVGLYTYPQVPVEWIQVLSNDVGSIDIDGFELQLVYRPRPAAFLVLTYAYANPEGEFLKKYEDLKEEDLPAYEQGVPRLCHTSPDVVQVSPDPEENRNYYPICWPFSGRAPEHSYSLLTGYRFASGWESSVSISGTSAFTWFGDGTPLPSYTRIDARLAKQFKIGSSLADVALIGQNLGGDYLEFRDDNVFDTRAYLQFSLSLP